MCSDPSEWLTLNLRKIFCQSVHDAPAPFFLFNFAQRFVRVLPIDPNLLRNGKEIKHKIVEVQPRRETIKQKREEDGHQPYHHFLTRVFHRHFLLNECGHSHEQGESAQIFYPEKWKVERQSESNIRDRKVLDPPDKTRLTQLNGRTEYGPQCIQYWKLKEERK